MAIGDLAKSGQEHLVASADEIDRCATTEDGIIWTERNLNNNARLYSTLAVGNPKWHWQIYMHRRSNHSANATAIVQQQVNVQSQSKCIPRIFPTIF